MKERMKERNLKKTERKYFELLWINEKENKLMLKVTVLYGCPLCKGFTVIFILFFSCPLKRIKLYMTVWNLTK